MGGFSTASAGKFCNTRIPQNTVSISYHLNPPFWYCSSFPRRPQICPLHGPEAHYPLRISSAKFCSGVKAPCRKPTLTVCHMRGNPKTPLLGVLVSLCVLPCIGNNPLEASHAHVNCGARRIHDQPTAFRERPPTSGRESPPACVRTVGFHARKIIYGHPRSS